MLPSRALDNESWEKAEKKMLAKAHTAADSAEIRNAYGAVKKLRQNVLLNPQKQECEDQR